MRKNDAVLTRRGFIAVGGVLAAGAVHGDAAVSQGSMASAPRVLDPFLGTQGVPLEVGAPCLQAPGETTVEIFLNPPVEDRDWSALGAGGWRRT